MAQACRVPLPPDTGTTPGASQLSSQSARACGCQCRWVPGEESAERPGQAGTLCQRTPIPDRATLVGTGASARRASALKMALARCKAPRAQSPGRKLGSIGL